jgi:hypothetical protein
MESLQAAAKNATELLEQAGFAGMRGDTADDLRRALAVHGHLVHEFNVKVRTSAGVTTFCTKAESAMGAAQDVAASHGDTPCGITVTPAHPDRQSLAAAHRMMRITLSLDDALKHPTFGPAVRTYARKHPVRSSSFTDFKSLAANDRD